MHKPLPLDGIGKTMKCLCSPLKLFKIDTDQIEVLVCISLSMIPILKREYTEMKEACIAKNISMNLKNSKIILTKLLLSFLKRIDQIDEALIEKGYDY